MDEIFKPLLSGKNPLPPKFNVNVTWSALSPMDERNQTPNITFVNRRAETLRFGGARVQHSVYCWVWFFLSIYCIALLACVSQHFLFNTALVLLVLRPHTHGQRKVGRFRRKGYEKELWRGISNPTTTTHNSVGPLAWKTKPIPYHNSCHLCQHKMLT